jgi:undecaprenol kinase
MKKFFKGFWHAFNGIIASLEERNMKFHVLAASLVISAGLLLRISKTEWIAVIGCVGLVLFGEMMNTSIEEVCNRLRDDLGLSYESTRRARDVSAGAVLILAVVAALIGVVVFLPKLVTLFL